MKSRNLLSRRQFSKASMAVLLSSPIGFPISARNKFPKKVRLGGPVFKFNGPDEWVQAHQDLGYSAAYCPLKGHEDQATIRSYQEAAQKANLVIAEVGAWSNPISPDDQESLKAQQKCIDKLALAEEIGARCCVNISGSRGEKWDGHHPDNFSTDTFDLIVETTRKIIDEVKPSRTFFTLEMMPWIFPDSAQSYLDLLKAIDRKQFGVHVDPVNIVSSPRKYYGNGQMIKEIFSKLGLYVKSCHAKDIILRQQLTTHLDEIVAGEGNIDYAVYLNEVAKLDGVPLMLEHLKTPAEYLQAATHLRKIADQERISM